MFNAATYAERRKLLRKAVGSGLMIFLANEESPMNYPANTYHYRQDSSFLYFFGLASPGLAAIVDADEGRDTLYGNDLGIEDIIWEGQLPKLKDRALEAGVRRTAPRAAFGEAVKAALAAGRTVHYLPPYRHDNKLVLSELLGIPVKDLKAKASTAFIKAAVAQRIFKSKEEIREMESAVAVSREMYLAAMNLAKPGRYEYQVSGAMEGIALAYGMHLAFPPIVTVNGQIFHMHSHDNVLAKGRMLVCDCGAEAASGYASDITRSIPVGGKFNARQKAIYEIVLAGQTTAIASIKPGVNYRDIHLQTARLMAAGLKDLGLMKGDTAAAVEAGAHALFFPHGLGHNIGLDVHDMEDYGENHVGYGEKIERSPQFGLAYLRMARELKPGHVLTVEPGLYFVPALVALWRKEKKHRDFIVYEAIEKWLDFGGVRLEDDVLVTEKGRRVLGPPIPKTVAEVEKGLPGLRIALVQQHATGDPAENRERGRRAFLEAARGGARLVAFAELAFTRFYPQAPAGPGSAALAEPIPGPTTDLFAALARETGTVAVLNLFERDGDRTYDSSPVIDADGRLLGVTRMVHIMEGPGFHERGYYAPGDRPSYVFDTAAGRVGVAICYDRHFPEYMRGLRLAGAELVVVPQAGAVGEWTEGIFEAELQVAAFQNGYFAALVNRVGREEALEFAGESFVVDPDGRVAARAPRGRDHILYAECDLSRNAASHAARHFLEDRRPGVYRSMGLADERPEDR